MRRGVFNKFNRGELASEALLRDDVEKVNNSCELMSNLVPQRLGPMSYRPGTGWIDELLQPVHMIPFVARTDDTAVIHMRADTFEVWVDDQRVQEHDSSFTLVNEFFDTDLSGWTDASGPGSTIFWAAGRAKFNGGDTSSAKLWQAFDNVTIGLEQTIVIRIDDAPMMVTIGTDGVDSKDIFEGTLDPGVHQLTFTPFSPLPVITFTNTRRFNSYLIECKIGTGGPMQLPLPTSLLDITSIRYYQSADVVFIAASNGAQFKIERRGKKSWGVVEYRADDGPFGLINNTEISLQAATAKGNAALHASDRYFEPTDVGRLYKLISSSQRVFEEVVAEDNGTDPIRVTGVGPVRKFRIFSVGTWSATVRLQRSPDELAWEDVEQYSGNFDKYYNDDLDNSILYYRLHIDAGEFTSGNAQLSMEYKSGSIEGICRAMQYVSPTEMGTQILVPMGDTESTRDWHVSEWGAAGKYPTAVSLYESRLWWSGQNKLWGSVSDEYASFDGDLEGDNAPVRKTIGFGPVDRIDWLANSSRLIAGVASDEISVRSSSRGVVLSQSNCNLKSGSTQGAAPIEPAKIDDRLLFVQRAGNKIMSADYSADTDSHITTDMMTLNPEICKPGIVRMAVARQPETRIYVVLTDGSMRIHLQDPAEDVVAWSRLQMSNSGLVQDVVVLPGKDEDVVYVTVERDGKLHYERLAQIQDMVQEHYDSSITYNQPATATLTGLDHLEGKLVKVWADRQERGDGYQVVGGSITIDQAGYQVVTVGLPYFAFYQSNKISNYLGGRGTAGRVVGLLKRVVDLSLIMKDYWPGSVVLGPDFDTLEPMPEIEFGKPVDPTVLIDEYDEHPFEFNGNDDIDPRIVLRVSGPCIILGLSYGVLTENEEREE